MRKRRMSPGGCLFTVGVVALVLFFGIFRLVTGHLPEYGEYMVWAFIAFSIFFEAYIEILKAVEESTTEIKEELKRMEDRIKEEIGKLKPK